MDNNNRIFFNNEGVGGFEQGLYDNKAPLPTTSNWTRQSCFRIPDHPSLLWKTGRDNAELGGMPCGEPFAINAQNPL